MQINGSRIYQPVYYSFLISTNKSIRDTKVGKNILKLNYLLKEDYEILIYSNIEVANAPNTKFFATNKDYGSSFGLNHIYNYSLGKYIIVIPDYAEIPDNIYELRSHLEQNQILAATFTACTHIGYHSKFKDDCKAHCRLTDCEVINGLITKYQNDLNKETLNDVPILFFPILRRDIIEIVLDGHIFNPYFKHRWVDNWLSLFLTRRNIKNIRELRNFICHTGECPVCGPSHTHNAKNDTYDLKIIDWLFKNGKNYLERPEFV